MVKTLFKILLYLSIVFLLWYLYQIDYLFILEIEFNYLALAFSLVFLFTGFLLSTLSWSYALGVNGNQTSMRVGLISHGLSVFAKYIPGKVWVILGRASYVSGSHMSLQSASVVSLKEQLIYLIWGLILGVLPVFFFLKHWLYGSILLLTIVLVCFVLYSKWFHNIFMKILSRIMRKPIDLPLISFNDTLKISRFVVLYWTSWIIAFYLLLLSVFPGASLLMAFAFPVGVTYGIMAILMPGGIGVREGILVAYMTAGGMTLEMAITISVVSRIWFVTGEIFLFLTAVILRAIYKDADYPGYPSTSQTTTTENH